MNPYEAFVTEFAGIVAKHKNLPLGGFPMPPKQKPPVLLMATHPWPILSV